MCACFRWHDLLAVHRANIDDVYYPRIADGHVKVTGFRMQENQVGSRASMATIRAGDAILTKNISSVAS
jgi:hypothetical protein